MSSESSLHAQVAASPLRQQLTAIWAHKRLLGAGLVVGLLASVAAFYLAGPRYTATADVLVRTTSTTPFEQGDVVRSISMQTEIEVAESEKVADFVVRQTRVDQTAAELTKGLRVTNPPDTAVLRFAYSAGDPEDAALFANEFAKSYLADRESRTLGTVNRLAKVLEDEQTTLTERRTVLDRQIERTTGDTERAALEAQRGLVLNEVLAIRNKLVETKTLDTTPGDVVQSATRPSLPDGPPLSTILAVGLVLGLALGIALAWIASLLGGRLSARADVPENAGAPVLGTLARRPVGETRSRKDAGPLATRDDARALALALAYGHQEDATRALLVVEPRGTDRAQQVAVELGAALAEMGRSVALLEADLRRPTLLDRLPAASTVGVLRAPGPLGGPDSDGPDAMAAADDGRWPTSDPVDLGGHGRLSLHPGLVEDDPVGTLARPEVAKFVAQLRTDADFVLVLAPALLTAVDGLEILDLVDGVLVVCDPRAVSGQDLRLTRDAVRGAHGRVVGVVQVGR